MSSNINLKQNTQSLSTEIRNYSISRNKENQFNTFDDSTNKQRATHVEHHKILSRSKPFACTFSNSTNGSYMNIVNDIETSQNKSSFWMRNNSLCARSEYSELANSRNEESLNLISSTRLASHKLKTKQDNAKMDIVFEEPKLLLNSQIKNSKGLKKFNDLSDENQDNYHINLHKEKYLMSKNYIHRLPNTQTMNNKTLSTESLSVGDESVGIKVYQSEKFNFIKNNLN